MKLVNYENSFLDFFQGSRIINFLAPHHFYTWIFYFLIIWWAWRKIVRFLKSIKLFFFQRKESVIVHYYWLSKFFIALPLAIIIAWCFAHSDVSLHDWWYAHIWR